MAGMADGAMSGVERIKSSGLSYEQPRFTFTPHCTLSFYPELSPERLREVLRIRFTEPVPLDSIQPTAPSISRAHRKFSICCSPVPQPMTGVAPRASELPQPALAKAVRESRIRRSIQ